MLTVMLGGDSDVGLGLGLEHFFSVDPGIELRVRVRVRVGKLN